MSMQRPMANRIATIGLTAAIVELTLTTAYIHLTLGGLLFTLNAIGYVVLAAAFVIAAAAPASVARFGWLPRIGLGGYTAATIGAYLVIGPYFPLGWVAKGIEAAMLTLLAVDLMIRYGSPRGIVRSALLSIGIGTPRGSVRVG